MFGGCFDSFGIILFGKKKSNRKTGSNRIQSFFFFYGFFTRNYYP